MESEMYFRNNETLSPLVFFHCAFGTRLNVRPEIRNGTEIRHTFGFLLT
jgi:hypothetical protein